jgi:hypothetical protein
MHAHRHRSERDGTAKNANLPTAHNVGPLGRLGPLAPPGQTASPGGERSVYSDGKLISP